ncbi:ATP-dependent DNA helicase [Hydrotalea sp.]|uniref:ATP-dependent helicase n=1 Tax=Hydrotalea sp. TaxID=2881279 RepID=UPI00261F55BC|nr:ATP-dependent DNA helicase [Hydrotalea sp.]
MQLNENFQKIYQHLNEEQKKAVDQIEGPVMVIAGPGTGKTQILSARIGKILLETDTLPENILCLTYTDAGVVAMRKRLMSFIGPDAYKVNIYTFHAFCNDIIQENLSLFEKTTLDPISDLERTALLKKLIDTFPRNHPLKRYRGDVYFETDNLQKLFSTMKREGWTPEHILSAIDTYLNDLPNREAYIYKKKSGRFNPGNLKENKIQEEHEKMQKLRAAVQEFDRFQELMKQNNRYDFDDMINWVIKAFEENPGLLLKYQEQFLYILVDEYQDTSGTQNKLVQLLINYWEQPNVFVVGDDDQSIYRFQGANIENMFTFKERFQHSLETIVLTKNYRSTQPILNTAKSVIDRNEERLVKQMKDLSKDLKAANAHNLSFQHLPVVQEYENPQTEMTGIILQIDSLLQQGIAPGKIAVIYKEHKFGEELAKYGAIKNIPVYTKKHINVFTIPFAKKLLLLLEYLAAEHDTPYGGDEMLFEILHFDWFQIPPIEIAAISVEVADLKFTAKKTSIRKLLCDKVNAPAKDLFTASIHPALKNASSIIENLIAAVPNVTLQNLFEQLISEAGIVPYIMQQSDKFYLLQVLTALFDFLKEETRRNPFLTLKELVRIIQLMQSEKIALPLVQVSGNEKGVNFLTAHGAKGLEFTYVFFAGCNASSWEKKRKPNNGYSFPDTLFVSAPNHKDEEELRRLFYVALTRAELYLTVSYANFKADGKPMEPSMFIAEMQENEGVTIEKKIMDETAVADFQALFFEKAAAPEIDKLENDVINRLLEKFVMNVTALNNYLKCPLEFYYKNLIRIPSPKNEATEFGSAVHYALEQLFKKMKDDAEHQFPSLEKFIADFEWYMHRHRESFTKEQFERRLEYGQIVLTNYYQEKVLTWHKIVVVEHTIKNVVINGVPLKGKLDKLEFDGRSVNVVDYKTGDYEKAQPKLLPPNDKNELGGDYWRQAVFYKILVDNDATKNWEVVSTEFDFVEPDKKNNFIQQKLVIKPEDVTTVKQQIANAWAKIQAHDFYTGCGSSDCHWCNFVKDNYLAIALHELNEEEI